MLKHIISESGDEDSTLGDDLSGLPFIHESLCMIADVQQQIYSV